MRDFIMAAKAVADPTRLAILKLLEHGELCVCHITDRLGLCQPTASRHLRILSAAGLVSARRDGRWVHYRLCREDVTSCNLAFLDLVHEHLPGNAAATMPMAQPLCNCEE